MKFPNISTDWRGSTVWEGSGESMSIRVYMFYRRAGLSDKGGIIIRYKAQGPENKNIISFQPEKLSLPTNEMAQLNTPGSLAFFPK